MAESVRMAISCFCRSVLMVPALLTVVMLSLAACASGGTSTAPSSALPWARGRTEPLPLKMSGPDLAADRWRPAWWRDGVMRDEATLTVWAMAEARDLSTARQQALAAAIRMFEREAGRKPANPATAAESTILSNGQFRAFVRLQAKPS